MSDSTTPSRPEKPQSRLPWILGAIVLVAALIVVAVTVLPGLFNGANADTDPASDDDTTAEPVTVRLGVADEGKSFWQVFVDEAAKENIAVEIVGFTDYSTPNPALASGDIDINKFQHVRYLAQHNVATGDDLQPVGATEIYPIGFYSKKWTSVEEIPEGAEVTLSNNPANQVRPLLALHNAGLIEFTGEADWSVTIDDVDLDNSVIGTITPIDPTQTAASLDSADIAFVDSPFALAAGLTAEQELYVEDVDREDIAQYTNIFAVRHGDETDPTYLKLVEIYHSDIVEKAILAEEGGFDGVFRETSVADLQKVLAEQADEFSQE